MNSLLLRLFNKLQSDVNGASLAFLRIAFGLVMAYHALKYLLPVNGVSLKSFLYTQTPFNFTYPGFEWVKPLPEPYFTALFIVVIFSALFVMAGFLYRLAASVLFLSYGYVFLTEAAKYNNHYYLMCLLAFLLIFVPADTSFSLKALLKREKSSGNISPKTVPYWCIFIFQAQLFIVYFYGGLAKINQDWLTGIPMVGKGREVLELFSPLIGEQSIAPLSVAIGIAWIGLFFDLSIGFLFVFRRTRLFALLLTIVFHGANHLLFDIGVFPVMALAMTLIFFEPDWPLRVIRWFGKLFKGRFSCVKPSWKWLLLGGIFLPVVGASLGWKDKISGRSSKISKWKSWVPWFIGGYLLVQILVPLRHLIISGDANWTEEGQDFSWRMMLRAKDASHVVYQVEDDQLILTQDGNAEINWNAWKDEKPKSIYVPISSAQFNWNHHPGLTATFEPEIGLRAIYRIPVTQTEAQAIDLLNEQWKKVFNRTINITPSFSLETALANVEKVFFKEGSSEDSEQTRRLIANIRNIQSDLVNAPPLAKEQSLAVIVGEIGHLKRLAKSPEIEAIFKQLHPFLLQGAVYSGERFLILNDPDINVDSKHLEAISGNNEFLVWVDLERLRPSEWKELPRWLVVFEDRTLRVIWNHHPDLNSIQKQRFSISPWMIRQHARHIASEWQKTTGRRPKVKAISSVMMNYRRPQLLLDPTVDLAEVPYYHSKHNPWILPMDSAIGSATNLREER